jgi:hypothetical protein
MVRDVDVNDPSAVVQQHDEDQQGADREGRVGTAKKSIDASVRT